MNQKPTSDMPAEIDMPQPGLGRRLVRNVLWNFGGQLWALALAFFTMPYIVGKLGTDAYGLLMTVGIVTNYLWFMDLGLGQATVKYVAEHAARNEWEEVNRIFWTSLVSYLVLGTLAALILVAIAPLCVTSWFQIPVDLQDEALSVFYLSAAGFVIGMVNNAPASIPRALQRFDIVNKVSVSVGTAQTLLTVILLALGYSVKEVVIGNVAIAVVSLLVNSFIVGKSLHHLSRPILNRRTFCRLLRFGGLTTIEDLVNPVLINWEKTILANQLSTRVLTFYMVPFNILSKLQMIPSSISSAAFPVFSGYHGSKNLREAHTLAVRSTRYTLILLLPIIVFMLVFGKALLVVWMGEEFAIRSIVPMYILAIATVATSLTFAPFSLLRGFGRPEVTMFVRLLEVPIYIPFTFLLVNMYGLVGASVSYLAYRILDAFLLWTVAVSRLQLPLQSFREAVPWYAIVTACVTGTVLWWISRQLCFDGSIPIIGIGLFLLVASTWWISWNCDIDDGERQLLIRSLVLL